MADGAEVAFFQSPETLEGLEENKKYANERKVLAQAFADFAHAQHDEDSWVAWADEASKSYPTVWREVSEFVRSIGPGKMKDFIQTFVGWVNTDPQTLDIPKIGVLIETSMKQTLNSSSITIAGHEQGFLTVVVTNLAMKTATNRRRTELETLLKSVASAYQKQVSHEESTLNSIRFLPQLRYYYAIFYLK